MSWKTLLLASVAVLWLVTVGVGLVKLSHYSLSPGAAGAPPLQWPASSRIQREPGQFTLVVAAHPQCPCSRATIGELSQLMTRNQRRVTAYVLFVRPAGFTDDWVRTDLWRSAAAIPGVTPIRDDEGVEALRFGAVTSGQTMLYDGEGRLMFSGGVTGARGHYGDNAGLAAVNAMLNGEETGLRASPVFGCALVASK
jgi:hypothetical protein